MKAPKEIYISNDHHGWYPENDGGDKIKYIRADLAELTWEDIAGIVNLADTILDGNEKEWGKRGKQAYYKAVLKAFNDKKK